MPHPRRRLRSLSPLVFALATGCTFYTTATHWNGRMGPEGKPVFVKTSTNVGMNLAIIVPVLGKTSIDEMLDVMTAEIARQGSDHIRVFETASENYWYGIPPLTWIFTPVITNVSVEYQPSDAEVAQTLKDDGRLEAATRARAEGDNSHIIPGARR